MDVDVEAVLPSKFDLLRKTQVDWNSRLPFRFCKVTCNECRVPSFFLSNKTYRRSVSLGRLRNGNNTRLRSCCHAGCWWLSRSRRAPRTRSGSSGTAVRAHGDQVRKWVLLSERMVRTHELIPYDLSQQAMSGEPETMVVATGWSNFSLVRLRLIRWPCGARAQPFRGVGAQPSRRTL